MAKFVETTKTCPHCGGDGRGCGKCSGGTVDVVRPVEEVEDESGE